MRAQVRGCACAACWRRRLVLVLLLLAVAAGRAGSQQLGRTRAICAECHADVRASHDRALSHADSVTCLTCHHIGYTSDAVQAAARREAACRGCHERLEPAHGDVPEGAPGCAQCHDIHDDPPLRLEAPPPERCRTCHEKPHALHANLTENAPSCTDCHTAHSRRPLHAEDARVSQRCASCHAGAHPSHPVARTGTRCTLCHSLAADPAASAVAAGARLAATCTACHRDLPAAHASAREQAPLCTDCHSFAHDPPLPGAAPAISERCGACHGEEMQEYRSGGHSAGLAGERPNEDLPTCSTCHPMHAAEREGLADVRLAATVRCIECHSNELLARKYDLPDRAGRSYTEDFHGETVQFLSQRAGAQARVLICSDCHGAHAVRQEGVPLAEVCLRCHQNGDSKLAGAWLGHAPVGPRNRPVIWLIRLFYYVLIPFVLAGLGLNIGFHLVDQRRKGARVLETPGIKRLRARLARKRDPAPATVVRFSRLERLEHLGAMTTFILLVVTGLPQTRPDLSAAQAIIGFFGGIGTARLIHRIAGFTFAALLILHVSRAVAAAIRRRRLPVMTPTRNDFLDTLHTVRHFVWGTPRPKTGKFDFAQKFEYWGLFLGGTLMSVTGLALVFDELITRILPGEAWAAFRVMHGLEATLAVLVVALWHFYGVILRPEIFPLDTSILTGKVTVDRLREEHRLEYERLFPHGPAA